MILYLVAMYDNLIVPFAFLPASKLKSYSSTSNPFKKSGEYPSISIKLPATYVLSIYCVINALRYPPFTLQEMEMVLLLSALHIVLHLLLQF